MNSDKISKIIQQVVEELSNNDSIAALVLAGSRVNGNKFPPDKFSDIELYVVAFDEKYEEAEKTVQLIQTIFGDQTVLAYKNQWAGWSVLFNDLLRLELPLVKASDETVFSRSEEQKIKILYSKPDFKLKKSQEVDGGKEDVNKRVPDDVIKDFWYMAVYAAQHIGRGEVWLARDAIRISMQGKVKRLLQEIYHQETLALDRNRRIELTWSQQELEILKETSSSYNKNDIIRSFWANIKYAEALLTKTNDNDLFNKYKNSLLPEIKSILDK